MTRTRYDRLTQGLHWSIALLVMGIYALGFGREFLPKGELKAWMLVQHISLGVAALALIGVRIVWRLTASPVAPAKLTPTAHVAARFAHMGLYVLMVAVPVAGLVAAWIKGRSVGFFGVPFANPFIVDVAYGKFLEGLHGWAAHGFMMLIGVHAAAALMHHYWLRDGIMNRMLPGGSTDQAGMARSDFGNMGQETNLFSQPGK